MKKKTILRGLLYTLAAIVGLIAIAALYVQVSPLPSYPRRQVDFHVGVTPERVERGRRTVTALCVRCHRSPETGALTGRHMADVSPKYGMVYSLNITQDREYGIGDWTDGELAYLLRTGVARDGRHTPPWMIKLPHMADEDLKDVIAFLRSDDPMVRPARVRDRSFEPSFRAKILARVVFKPLPYPEAPVIAPPVSDTLAYGRYLVTGKHECYGCHSRDFSKLNVMQPERSEGYLGGGIRMRDARGGLVYTANLTSDPETGLGAWSEADFRRTLKLGLRPDGRALRSPMTALPELTDAEISAIWAYLRSVPPLRHPVPRPAPTALPAVAEGGRHVYYKYGCHSCHGDTGVGTYDLLKGLRGYPSDEALVAYFKHPERSKPGVKMPTWDGVIQEHEYAPLVRFVRGLGTAGERSREGAAATGAGG